MGFRSIVSAGPAENSSRSTLPQPACHVLYCDGASRGNPGRAAIGYVLLDASGAEIVARGEALTAETTNNVAEYEALCGGLRAAVQVGARCLRVRMDSELVVRQMLGVYKVRHPGLRSLFETARSLSRQFVWFEIEHVRRAENARADELANQALDAALPDAPPSC